MSKYNLEVSLTVQTFAFSMSILVRTHCFPRGKRHQEEMKRWGLLMFWC